jgi:uncharacterized membrane protein (UPF0136 family)
MYEPYRASEPPQRVERLQPPRTVLTAIRLMYLGAAIEVVALIVALLIRGSLRASIRRAHPFYTLRQLHNAENVRTGILVIGAVIAIAAWLWMAWANGRGLNWARIVSAVLLGISTLSLILSIGAVRSAGSLIVGVVIWLVGLAVIVLIFNKSSSPFYRQEGDGGGR